MKRYEYEVQGDYGYGWNTLVTEETLATAMVMLQCYRENETKARHRIKKITVKQD